MSIFAEFHLQSEAMAFARTLAALPDAVVEIERVAASERVLTPYFWVSEVQLEAFEAAVGDDPSVRNLHRIDRFEETGLYRAEWIDEMEAMTYTLLDFASVVISATATHERWEIELRFEDTDQLSTFQEFVDEYDVDVTVRRLFEATQPLTGSQYGLTEKQQEALVAAWEAGYFETPRRATLTEIADGLGITQQSLSNRLRRGHGSLIANTLTIQRPTGE